MGCSQSAQDSKVMSGDWYIAATATGELYWYNEEGYTTWQRPENWVDTGQDPAPAPKPYQAKTRKGLRKKEEGEWGVDASVDAILAQQVTIAAVEQEEEGGGGGD
eukprot:TRINITY_DN22509_c0_g1_i1.p1 TRINITY_DN22509_c0_g1~~TRINITY_DN22509_c0_g1_i1.p1  ORF type:complete len:105 (+),score=19.28 TRINITY_DN22509_c0_g1_i1:182-496(+)